MRLSHLLVCAGCALTVLPACSKSPEAPSNVARTQVTAPIDVQTARTEGRQVPLVIRATGSFIPDESSDVTPQVAGTVVETLAQVGDMVKAGAVIVKLDDRDARIRLNQVKASLRQAEAESWRARMESERNADLATSGDISRSTYDRLTAQVLIAEAAVALVKSQLAAAEKAVEDMVISAPFAGHVSARPASVGEFVTTAARLLTLVRISPIKLNLQVPESEATRLQTGMLVEVTVPAHQGAVFTGSVGALNVAIDPNSRSMTVEARFPNTDSRLTPGMFGSAEVRLPTTAPGVFVPAAAVAHLANGDASVVYAIENNQVYVKVVQVSEEANGVRRVISGLPAGATVAISGLDMLFDGAEVRVVGPQPETAAAPDSSTGTSHAQAR
jgi:RND family efflux transporter MFP subunit